MLHPLDLLTYFERKFRSFHSSNEESAGQRAAKLPSAKREWNPGGVKPRHACTHFGCNGWSGRLFLWHPTLKASNFVALWPTDPILLAWKDPNLFDIHYTYYLVKRLAVFLRWVLLLGWFKSGKNDKLDIFLLIRPDSESFGKWCLEKCKNFFDKTTLMPAECVPTFYYITHLCEI